MAQPKRGPYGEAIFPKAEEDLRLDSVVRYRTREPYADVARFYREQYEPIKHMVLNDGEHQGDPCLALAPGKRCQDVQFGTLVVMTDPESKKKRRVEVVIVVTPRYF